jgi:hypothetical protein
VRIDSINGDYDGANVRLAAPLKNNYDGDAWLYIPSGVLWCVSQLHFEKDQITERVTPNLEAWQENPRRYRVAKHMDIKNQGELDYHLAQETNRSKPRFSFSVVIDGDPRYHIGFLANVALDPTSPQPPYDPSLFTYGLWKNGSSLPLDTPDLINVFKKRIMMIDDLEYIVEGTDFYMRMTLGPSDYDIRSYPYDLSQLQGAIQAKSTEDTVGRTVPSGNETRDAT